MMRMRMVGALKLRPRISRCSAECFSSWFHPMFEYAWLWCSALSITRGLRDPANPRAFRSLKSMPSFQLVLRDLTGPYIWVGNALSEGWRSIKEPTALNHLGILVSPTPTASRRLVRLLNLSSEGNCSFAAIFTAQSCMNSSWDIAVELGILLGLLKNHYSSL
jgi:hypothetical protein